MRTLIQDGNNLFINPYNFVSMTSDVKRDFKRETKLSGYISCTLKVKEALIIPDKNDPIKEATDTEGATYNFYNIGGEAVIPGSEIRGCIRSVFEAVTPSCFSVIDNSAITGREFRPNNHIKPGILERHNGQWKIYEANYRNQKRRFYENEFGESDFSRCWQLKGEKVELGWAYFYKRNNKKAIICSDKDIEKLKYILKQYLKNTKDDEKNQKNIDEKKSIINSYIDALNKMENSGGESSEKIPVFFNELEGKMIYISAAHTGRKVYDKTIKDLLGEKHSSCTGEKGYCPACLLFGTIGKNKPVASKLRFEDATAVDVKMSDYLIIPELSSPKISSIEFYTKNKLFTNNGAQLKNVRMWDYDTEGTALNGRKFYFHSKPDFNYSKFEKRQMKTQAALEGSTFKFKVYFDNVDEEHELKMLLWVLTFGENDIAGNLMHKMGAGRPVGFGSVKIVVDNIMIRRFDNKTDYSYNIEKKEYEHYHIEKEDFFYKNCNDAVKDMITIANYNFTEGHQVSYPIADNGEDNDNAKAGHQWFTANRRSDNKFRDILPTLNNKPETLELCALKPFEENTIYDAQVKSINNGKVNINVCDCSSDIALKYFHFRIEKGRIVKVIFKKYDENGKPVFWVAKLHNSERRRA